MMKLQITFGHLERVLADLGFDKKTSRASAVVYKRLVTGTTLIVSLHQPGDQVPDFVLASIRHHLELKEEVSADAFDEMLQAIAA